MVGVTSVLTLLIKFDLLCIWSANIGEPDLLYGGHGKWMSLTKATYSSSSCQRPLLCSSFMHSAVRVMFAWHVSLPVVLV